MIRHRRDGWEGKRGRRSLGLDIDIPLLYFLCHHIILHIHSYLSFRFDVYFQISLLFVFYRVHVGNGERKCIMNLCLCQE